MSNKLIVVTVLLSSLTFSGVSNATGTTSLLDYLKQILEEQARQENCTRRGDDDKDDQPDDKWCERNN